MTPGAYARPAAAVPLDLAKRDLALTRGGRAFTIRAYHDDRDPTGPGWHAVIVERRTPLSHALGAAPDPEACLAAAVRFLTATVPVEAAAGEEEREHGRVGAWESEGGASAVRHGIRTVAVPGMTGGPDTP